MNIKIFDKIIEQNPRVILLGREMSLQMFPLLILIRLLLLSSGSKSLQLCCLLTSVI